MFTKSFQHTLTKLLRSCNL